MLLVNIAIVGGAALNLASRAHADSTLERAVFGSYLGAVMAHFVVDAGLWRLRDTFPRRFLQRRLCGRSGDDVKVLCRNPASWRMPKSEVFLPLTHRPQPRIDLVATSAITGQPIRVTTHRGLVWLGEVRHEIPQEVTASMGSSVVFVLPDSLTYDGAFVGTTTIAAEAMPQTTHGAPGVVLACAGRLVAGPDGLARVELSVPIFGRIAGLTYNVSVEAPIAAVH